MADLLGRIATSLSDGSVLGSANEWLRQSRSLGSEIRRVDDALRQAEESIRLNPRSVRQAFSTISLRESLETLEHETTVIRILSRVLADLTRLGEEDNPINDPQVRSRLSEALWELSRRSGRTAAWSPSMIRPGTRCWRPSCSGTWAWRGISRTGSASCWPSIPPPSRSDGRCGAS